MHIDPEKDRHGLYPKVRGSTVKGTRKAQEYSTAGEHGSRERYQGPSLD